jgi:hypothetical protein
MKHKSGIFLLEKNGQMPRQYILPKLNHEVIENWSRLITSTVI